MTPGERLTAHLSGWLGTWPPGQGLTIVGSRRRVEPGWDGEIRAVAGVATPTGTVLSVPPRCVDDVRRLGDDVTEPRYGPALAALLGRPGGTLGRGVFRWSGSPAALPAAGEWLSRADPRLPAWLRPFNGEVLVTLLDGAYAAGVGIKRHDDYGWEISVGTTEAARGQGLARRLVAQAARAILAAGAVPTYLHDPRNVASARVADAAGFPDDGWSVCGLFG